MTPPDDPEGANLSGGQVSRGEGKLRDRYRFRMEQWRAEGYNVLPLEAVMDQPLELIKEAFNAFRRAVYQLKDVEVELLLLDAPEFHDEIETLSGQLKDVARVDQVRRDFSNLRERIRAGGGRARPAGEDHTQFLRRQALGWREAGFDVSELEGLIASDPVRAATLARSFASAEETFHQLQEEIRHLDLLGLEREASHAERAMKDLGNPQAAREAMQSLRQAIAERDLHQRGTDQFTVLVQVGRREETQSLSRVDLTIRWFEEILATCRNVLPVDSVRSAQIVERRRHPPLYYILINRDLRLHASMADSDESLEALSALIERIFLNLQDLIGPERAVDQLAEGAAAFLVRNRAEVLRAGVQVILPPQVLDKAMRIAGLEAGAPSIAATRGGAATSAPVVPMPRPVAEAGTEVQEGGRETEEDEGAISLDPEAIAAVTSRERTSHVLSVAGAEVAPVVAGDDEPLPVPRQTGPVVTVFEDLFSRFLGRFHQNEPARQRLRTAVTASKAQSPILQDLRMPRDGGVQLSLGGTDPLEQAEFLIELFGVLVEVAAISVGKERAYEMAVEDARMAIVNAGPSSARLQLDRRLLRGALSSRVPSGIRGLDPLLGGGIPRGSDLLLQAASGAESEALLTNFLARGLLGGEAVVAIVSNYPPDLVRRRLQELGLDSSAYEEQGLLRFVDWYSFRSKSVVGVEQEGAVYKASVDLTNVGIALNKALRSLAFTPTRRAMVDIISSASQHFEFEILYRFCQNTKAKLANRGFTGLYILDRNMHDQQFVSSFQQIFDGVIELAQSRGRRGRITTTLGVLALREGPFDGTVQPLRMKGGRLIVGSREDLEAHEETEALRRRVDSWALRGYQTAALDDLLEAEELDLGSLRVAIEAFSTNVASLEAARASLEAIDHPAFAAAAAELMQRVGEVAAAPQTVAEVERLREAVAQAVAKEAAEAAARQMAENERRAREAEQVARARERPAEPPAARATGLPKASATVSGRSRPPRGRSGVNARGRGLTNGKGLTNGRALTNGSGRVNGRALTNGNGRVNGRGLTNGAPPERNGGATRLARAGPLGIPLVMILALAVVAMVIALAVFVAFNPITPPSVERIEVDGHIEDWRGVPIISSSPDDVSVRAIDLVGASALREGPLLFLRGTTQGAAMGVDGSQGVAVTEFFLDADPDRDAGYRIGGLFADALVRVSGWDGSVRSTALLHFDDSRSSDDWNGWEPVGGVDAAARGGELEVRIDLRNLQWETATVLSVLPTTRDDSGNNDRGMTLTPFGGTLAVTISDVGASGVAPGQTGVVVTTLRCTALGGAVELAGIHLLREGNLAESDLSAVSIARGGTSVPLATGMLVGDVVRLTLERPLVIDPADRSITLQVRVDVSESAMTGSAFRLGVPTVSGFQVHIADGRGEGAAVDLRTDEVRGTYLGTPTRVVIDGGFEDWISVPGYSDVGGDVTNPAIDLQVAKIHTDPTLTAFMLQVSGAMLSGSSAPDDAARPSPPTTPGGGPRPLPVLEGVDTAWVLIDTDGAPTSGWPYGSIGIEYLLQVTGRHGHVSDAQLLRHDPSQSGALPFSRDQTIDAMDDETHLEMGLPSAILGNLSQARFLFQMTDWHQQQDRSAVLQLPAGRDIPWQQGVTPIPGGQLPGGSTGGGPKDIPEFDDMLVPVIGMLMVIVVLRRRRVQTPLAEAARSEDS